MEQQIIKKEYKCNDAFVLRCASGGVGAVAVRLNDVTYANYPFIHFASVFR